MSARRLLPVIVLMLGWAGTSSLASPATASSIEERAETEDAALARYLDAAFDQAVALSPETEAGLGMARDQDRLDDRSELALRRRLALTERQATEMARRFAIGRLGSAGRLNFRLFEAKLARDRAFHKWRHYIAPSSIDGGPLDALAFLVGRHTIATRIDAENYIARLKAIEPFLSTLAQRIDTQREMGVTPTARQIAALRVSSRAYVSGAPFETAADGPLLADFKKKLAKLDWPAMAKETLITDASEALRGPVRRGYERYVQALDAVTPLARKSDGVWSLPQGNAYYAAALQRWTDTDLDAEAIHQIGLGQVATIKVEMTAIMHEIGYNGTLNDFFELIRTDKRFQYSNDEAGRAQYLADATRIVNAALAAAPRFFEQVPSAPIEVRAVEKWRENASPTAFYDPASPDGTRPGIFYVNLADMRQVQKVQLPGIAYHEAVPGHHFQVSIAQEAGSIPKFRRFDLSYGAYMEGWGLYAERLADEMRLYKTPYERFGMLSLQMWRACRLVLDTGIHAKHWSREQAVAYFQANSSLSQRDIEREVDRYIGSPGQATAYTIGLDRITALRQRATQRLGAKFNLGGFHEVLLRNGPLPWRLLDDQVDSWIHESAR